MKNKVELKICGQSYNIVAEEPPEYMQRVASLVEKKVEEIMASNERLSMSMAAVLASVNLCDEWMKAQSSSDHLRGQLKQYLDDASRSRQEVDEGKREIMRLRAEIQDLKLQIAKMDNKTRP